MFKCIANGQDYITLKYNYYYYRVKDNLFTPVPAPKYDFGKIVKIKKNKENAIITDIMWHYVKHQHYYFVSVKNKKIKEIFGFRVYVDTDNLRADIYDSH